MRHLSADGTKAFAEIAGGGTIPQSVLDEHMSNSKITGIVFSDKGLPLWQGHTKNVATGAQKRALTALDGGCGERPVLCQAHHIRPVSQGGPTDITNMVLICWSCHQKIHRHGWRAVRDGRRLYTIEPPDRVHYGPACAPDNPTSHGPEARRVTPLDDTTPDLPTTRRVGPYGPAAARAALRQASTGRASPTGSNGSAATRQVRWQGSQPGPSPPAIQTPETLFGLE